MLRVETFDYNIFDYYTTLKEAFFILPFHARTTAADSTGILLTFFDLF